MTTHPDSVTRLMAGVRTGNRDAIDALLPLVHAELRRIASAHMRRERPGHTLQPTALVNEAYLRLVDQTDVEWQNRAHFLAVASRLMRRILVVHARSKATATRDTGSVRVELDDVDIGGTERDIDLLALDEALERLSAMDPRLSEVVENRYFGGLTTRETAEAMHLSTATVEREWVAARAWLRRELFPEESQ
jgi:RNA polymerase sigma-70 factor (ECF subfamily)